MIDHLAIVGATGAVGAEACRLVGDRDVAVNRVSLLASARSAGRRIRVRGEHVPVAALTDKRFDGVDYAIFSAGGETSRRFAPVAVAAGAVVIDNSSAFRMEEHVPLVIPEINPSDAQAHRGIIANPNCSTIIMNVVVWPLHRANPV
ncbi:MAG: aspartate-semialdehyde dehydrogenase, partial [Phycisphaerae bacterium]